MRTYVQMKKMFFDRPVVMRAVDAGRARGLSRWAAYIRKRARSSIRTRKRVSNPGEPPSSHSPEPNLRTILFGFDVSTQSTLVGPVKLQGRSKAQPVGATTPELLEGGGILQLPRTKRRPARRVRVAARAFMGPAAAAEQKNAPPSFVNVIKP